MKGKISVLTLIPWFLLWGLYLLCAGSASPAEVVAGAASAGFVTWLLCLLPKDLARPLRFKARWLVLLLRIPWATLKESWLLTRALLLHVRGLPIDEVQIEHPLASVDERHRDARDAFMTFGVCITPNSYLVCFDAEKGVVVIRQLVGKELARLDRLFVELT